MDKLSQDCVKYARLDSRKIMDQDKDLTQSQSAGDSATAVKEADPRVGEPKRYAVFLHNDDYTTMEFVVEVLTTDFSKPQEEAVGLMLRVHEEGKAVAGIYSFEIAESKIAKVTEKARRAGFPLKLTMEPVERSES
jgi:ATP-dependent Clp protease adaptor protein ClpS